MSHSPKEITIATQQLQSLKDAISQHVPSNLWSFTLNDGYVTNWEQLHEVFLRQDHVGLIAECEESDQRVEFKINTAHSSVVLEVQHRQNKYSSYQTPDVHDSFGDWIGKCIGRGFMELTDMALGFPQHRPE